MPTIEASKQARTTDSQSPTGLFVPTRTESYPGKRPFERGIRRFVFASTNFARQLILQYRSTTSILHK
jgi:hypothetical protein